MEVLEGVEGPRKTRDHSTGGGGGRAGGVKRLATLSGRCEEGTACFVQDCVASSP